MLWYVPGFAKLGIVGSRQQAGYSISADVASSDAELPTVHPLGERSEFSIRCVPCHDCSIFIHYKYPRILLLLSGSADALYIIFRVMVSKHDDGCSEPEPEPSRWMVHFLARRMYPGDRHTTTTVFSICSDYRPDGETAQHCVMQTLRQERAAGWQISSLWPGFFSARYAWNRR